MSKEVVSLVSDLDNVHVLSGIRRFCFLAFGVGKVISFSALTQPVDYWNVLFPESNLLMYICEVFMNSNIIILFLLVAFTKISPNVIRYRTLGGFLGQFLMVALVPLVYLMRITLDAQFYFILVLTFFIAFFTSLIESSIFALASSFPMKDQEDLQLGVGLSTLISNIFKILTKISFNHERQGIIISSSIFFGISCIVLLLCVASYLWLSRDSFSSYHLNIKKQKSSESELAQPDNECLDKKKVFCKTFFSGLAVCFLFFTTFTIWPALVAEIKAPNFPHLVESYWWALILLFLFSFFDVIGRFMVSIPFGFGRRSIWIILLLRLLCVPFLILNIKNVAFTHEAYAIVAIILLGLTNGFCGSLTIILMNELGDTDTEKRYIGTLVSFYLNIGLFLGINFSLFVQSVLVSK
jgi:equilibrative nucleoside transporter 1/2/3